MDTQARTRHSNHAEQWLPCPAPQVFAFFANPANLPRLMPAWQKPRIDWSLSSTPLPLPAAASEAAGVGSRIAISFRPFPCAPFRMTWEAQITEFSWNDHFCDVQSRGPFRYWKHCHRVEATTSNGVAGTTITDHVEYELPFGLAGDLAHRIFLRRQIARTFTYRQSRLAELLAPAQTELSL